MKYMDFLKIHQDSMESQGFWREEYRSVLMGRIESWYSTEVLREWEVSDFVDAGNKVLMKFTKRLVPLTDEEIKDKYGREL